MQVRLAALAAELRGALRALLPLRLAHRFPGQAIHFIRGRDGGAGNWCGRRRRRHLGDPGARRLPRWLARAIGGGRARRAYAPARVPRAAHGTAPHCRIPAPRGRIPGLAEGRAGARGPHKLLTPGDEGGRRRARSLDGWGERAGADAGRASRPLSARSPDRSSAAAARAVRPSRRRALVLLSAMAPHRPGRPPAPRSLDPWILGALPSLSLPRLPAAHGARPGSNCYNLRGWLAPVRGDSVRVRARYRGPGGGPRGGWGGRKAFD